jgi:hypothetical protein
MSPLSFSSSHQPRQLETLLNEKSKRKFDGQQLGVFSQVKLHLFSIRKMPAKPVMHLPS